VKTYNILNKKKLLANLVYYVLKYVICRLVLPSKLPDKTCTPPNLLFIGHWGIFVLRWCGQGMKLTTIPCRL